MDRNIQRKVVAALGDDHTFGVLVLARQPLAALYKLIFAKYGLDLNTIRLWSIFENGDTITFSILEKQIVVGLSPHPGILNYTGLVLEFGRAYMELAWVSTIIFQSQLSILELAQPKGLP
jgi:hypothetical protein